MTFKTLFVLAVILCYSLGTLLIFIGTLSMRRSIKISANWFTLAGFALHTLLTIQVLLSHTYAELSAGYFIQLLSWVLIFVYILAWRFLRMHLLSLTAAPLALLLFTLSLRLENITSVLPENWSGLFVWLHICSLFISIGLLALAFSAGIFFVFLDRKIKKKIPVGSFIKDLPALSTFDKVNKTAVIFGFPLYTLGLIASFIWLPLSQAPVENPKILISLFIWFLYALLFYQRTALGYQGRKTAIMAIVIFTLCALSFGLDFYLTHHGQLFQQLL